MSIKYYFIGPYKIYRHDLTKDTLRIHCNECHSKWKEEEQKNAPLELTMRDKMRSKQPK